MANLIDDMLNGKFHGIDAVMFDLDGTLIDSVPAILEGFRYASKKVLGKECDPDQIRQLIGKPLLTMMQNLSIEHADELVKVYIKHNLAIHDEWVKIFPDSMETLEYIKSLGKAMAIVTSKGAISTKKAVNLFDFDSIFSCIVTLESVKVHKPDAAPLLYAAKKLGVDIKKSIYVGDSPFDIQSAKNAGAISIAAMWGASKESELLHEKPDFACRSMVELRRVFSGDAEDFIIY